MLPQLPASQAAAKLCESVAQWWPQHRAIAAEHPSTIQQAIVGGFVADRVGWAFASGYQAALHALFPDAPGDRICALCVTEADASSPTRWRVGVGAPSSPGPPLDLLWTSSGPVSLQQP